MATETATLFELSQRLGRDGNLAAQKVVELQSKTNLIWQVLPMKECNDGSREKVMLRSKLPDIAWRMLNKGTKPSLSSVTSATYTTGGVEALVNVDERMLQLQKNANQWRLSEDFAHQEAMTQKMCETIMYGDEKTNPAGFTGLGAHFYKPGTDLYGKQLVDAGGTTANKMTSVWMITFAEDTVYGIYPQGTTAGYKHRDNGRVQFYDENNDQYWGYQSQYNWDMGLAIRDPRHVVRVCNIDTTKRDDTAFISTLIEAFGKLENPDHGRTVILANRAVETYLAILAQNKANVNLSINEFAGKKITHFWGCPLIRMDVLKNDEKFISF